MVLQAWRSFSPRLALQTTETNIRMKPLQKPTAHTPPTFDVELPKPFPEPSAFKNCSTEFISHPHPTHRPVRCKDALGCTTLRMCSSATQTVLLCTPPLPSPPPAHASVKHTHLYVHMIEKIQPTRVRHNRPLMPCSQVSQDASRGMVEHCTITPVVHKESLIHPCMWSQNFLFMQF